MKNKIICITIFALFLSIGNVVYSAIKDDPTAISVQKMPLITKEQIINKDRVILPIVSGVTSDGVITEENEPNADSFTLNSNPDPYFKANIGKVDYKNFKVNDIISFESLKKNNGKLKLAKVMTYSMYQQMYSPDSISHDISPNRMIYVVQIHYPDGFHHAKVGLIKNCLVTGLYDIETAQVLESDFERLD
ncbi:hypothetical protein CIB95_14865 [Lottiidibacillus patelloidae]|uniref:Uncharacterized protein n=1 Tax=Lottiidibacillus patelloidae TaxID=2670334 RepID=A0A263BQT0_9BACI|nr:hypothetical protein [Lottiidibacillus patelloidae]OZM55942.1 hypothetical protein CIB95_14865 [Lottiidibacillus patelloidae]